MAQQEILGMQGSADVGRPRGCSDFVTGRVICHNEDGSASLLERGKFVRFGFVPEDRPPRREAGGSTTSGGHGSSSWGSTTLGGRGFDHEKTIRATGFCYPGALPGWGPCYNSAGVGYSINFLFPNCPILAYYSWEPAAEQRSEAETNEEEEEVAALPAKLTNLNPK